MGFAFLAKGRKAFAEIVARKAQRLRRRLEVENGLRIVAMHQHALRQCGAVRRKCRHFAGAFQSHFAHTLVGHDIVGEVNGESLGTFEIARIE